MAWACERSRNADTAGTSTGAGTGTVFLILSPAGERHHDRAGMADFERPGRPVPPPARAWLRPGEPLVPLPGRRPRRRQPAEAASVRLRLPAPGAGDPPGRPVAGGREP